MGPLWRDALKGEGCGRGWGEGGAGGEPGAGTLLGPPPRDLPPRPRTPGRGPGSTFSHSFSCPRKCKQFTVRGCCIVSVSEGFIS